MNTDKALSGLLRAKRLLKPDTDAYRWDTSTGIRGETYLLDGWERGSVDDKLAEGKWVISHYETSSIYGCIAIVKNT